MCSLGVLEANITEVGAVVGGTDAWCAHARQDVLLDHNPALIADGGEGMGDRSKVDGTAPQLTKNPGLDGGKVIELCVAGAGGDFGLAIFEVDEADMWGKYMNERYNVGRIIAGTIEHMPSIKHQTEYVAVDVRKETPNLVGSFDNTGTMVMEGAP